MRGSKVVRGGFRKPGARSLSRYQFKKDRGRKLLYGCFLLLVSGPNGSDARYISIYENPEAFGHDNIHQPPP